MWKIAITIWLIIAPAVMGYNLTDFSAFSAEWQTCRSPGYVLQWDLDGSGCVDLPDLMIFAERWLDMSSFPNKVEVSGITQTGNALAYNGEYERVADDGNGNPVWEKLLETGIYAQISYGDYYVGGPHGSDRWTIHEKGMTAFAYVLFLWAMEGTTEDGPDGEYTGYESATGTATVTAYEAAAPEITGVVADTDSLTVSLTGTAGATHTVLYKLTTTTDWIVGGTRVDDGDVTIGGLSAGSYQVIAYSTIDGINSTPGNMVTGIVQAAGAGLIQNLAIAFRRPFVESADLQAALPGGFYFSHCPEDITRPYGVFTWDGTDIDEICGAASNRLEKVRLNVSLFTFGDDGGLDLFDIADKFMQVYDWAVLTYTDYSHIKCQRMSAMNQGLLDNIWQVDIEYEIEVIC